MYNIVDWFVAYYDIFGSRGRYFSDSVAIFCNSENSTSGVDC